MKHYQHRVPNAVLGEVIGSFCESGLCVFWKGWREKNSICCSVINGEPPREKMLKMWRTGGGGRSKLQLKLSYLGRYWPCKSGRYSVDSSFGQPASGLFVWMILLATTAFAAAARSQKKFRSKEPLPQPEIIFTSLLQVCPSGLYRRRRGRKSALSSEIAEHQLKSVRTSEDFWPSEDKTIPSGVDSQNHLSLRNNINLGAALDIESQKSIQLTIQLYDSRLGSFLWRLRFYFLLFTFIKTLFVFNIPKNGFLNSINYNELWRTNPSSGLTTSIICPANWLSV